MEQNQKMNKSWKMMAVQGLKKKDIAEKLGISRATLYRWEVAENKALAQGQQDEKGRKLTSKRVTKNGDGLLEGEGRTEGDEGHQPKEDFLTEATPCIMTALVDENKKGAEIESFSKQQAAPGDDLVEKALYQRATGYMYEEVTKELIDGELQVKKVVQKQVAPDISAQI